MADELARRLVPDELWDVVLPLIPPPKTRPQGGGRSRADDRAVFTAITYVLTSGCPWRALPHVFGVKPPTVHRRFGEWVSLSLWDRLHEETVARYGDGVEVSWTRALAESVVARTGDDELANPRPAVKQRARCGPRYRIATGSAFGQQEVR